MSTLLFVPGSLLLAAHVYGVGTPDVVRASGFDVAVDGSGKVVIAGHGNDDYLHAEGTPQGRQLTVWRYTADGLADSSFNGAGLLRLTGECGTIYDGAATAIWIDPAGNLVVAGNLNARNCTPALAIRRFNPDGTVDPTFIPVGAGADNETEDLFADSFAKDMVADGTGNLYVIGVVETDTASFAALWRFRRDGSPNTDFGTNGIVRVEQTDPDETLYASAIGLDRNGRILVTGSRTPVGGEPRYQLAVWRFTPEGNPDLSFAGSGAIFAQGKSDGADIVGDSQGRIVICGSSVSAADTQQMTVWRLRADGTPDPSLGSDGVVRGDFGPSRGGWSYGADLAIDDAGRIVIAGTSGSSVTVWRLLEDGTPDSTFGSGGGTAASNTGGGYLDQGWAVALNENDGIIVAGSSMTANILAPVDGGVREIMMATWRFTPDGKLDSSFGSGGAVLHYGTD